jgi:raffinose/stachyose/melibiose transport system permease protein
MLAVFVLVPLLLTIVYSFFRWNGVGPATWVGLKNYVTVFEVPDLLGTIFNAFWLVVWFSFIPVGLGLVVASVIHRVATGRLGAMARTVLFLPQVIPLVAAGIIWGWLLALPGLINQILKAVGLGAITRAWLGDFDWALPCRPHGIWVLLGFCTVLLLTGMTKVDAALYESARIDGAGWFREFVAITAPLLRYEIGVCLTVTVIAALAAFDIVYVATAGGPGNSTAVPGIQIYILALPSDRWAGICSPSCSCSGRRCHRPIQLRGRRSDVGWSRQPWRWAPVALWRCDPAFHQHLTAAASVGDCARWIEWPAEPRWGNFGGVQRSEHGRPCRARSLSLLLCPCRLSSRRWPDSPLASCGSPARACFSPCLCSG